MGSGVHTQCSARARQEGARAHTNPRARPKLGPNTFTSKEMVFKKNTTAIRFEHFRTQTHATLRTQVAFTQAYKLKARVFHYPKDREKKIKKRKPHKKEKQNDSDVLVYTRYGNTYKLSKLWSEKSCYQATVKRVL